MKKVIGIDDWIFSENISDDERVVDVSIHLKYPDLNEKKFLIGHANQTI